MATLTPAVGAEPTNAWVLESTLCMWGPYCPLEWLGDRKELVEV